MLMRLRRIAMSTALSLAQSGKCWRVAAVISITAGEAVRLIL